MRPLTAGGRSTRRERSRLGDRLGGHVASMARAQPSRAAPHGRRPNHSVCSCHHAPRGGTTNSVFRVMLVMYVRCVSVSDTVIPHNLRFPGTPDCHPGAGCRQCRATGGSCEFLLSEGLSGRVLACFYCDGLRGSGCACQQVSGGLVVGKDDLVRAQIPDRLLRAGSAPGVGSSSGAPPPRSAGLSCEQQVHRGQLPRMRSSRM